MNSLVARLYSIYEVLIAAQKQSLSQELPYRFLGGETAEQPKDLAIEKYFNKPNLVFNISRTFGAASTLKKKNYDFDAMAEQKPQRQAAHQFF